MFRWLAHVPFGWRPTTLLVRVRRYRCEGCGRLWRQDTTAAAEPRAKLSRAAVRWTLVGLVAGHLTVTRAAEALAVAWHTANDAVLTEGRRALIDDAHRFDGATVIGVDEHVWHNTRRGQKYVTAVIDLTPIRDDTCPARLLDMVEGRSKQAFKAWLAARAKPWRECVEVAAMDGYTKTAAAVELPPATVSWIPSTSSGWVVTPWAGADSGSRRTSIVHRGRRDDPLYRAHRTLRTGADLLSEKQRARISALFAGDEHVQVEATWGIYQRMIAAYRHPDRAQGSALMTAVNDSVSTGAPAVLSEVITIGRTLKKRAADALAYFERPGTSNSPTEAINGRLEHLPRLRPWVPQPHPLHRPLSPRGRRLQATPAPSTAMSPESTADESNRARPNPNSLGTGLPTPHASERQRKTTAAILPACGAQSPTDPPLPFPQSHGVLPAWRSNPRRIGLYGASAHASALPRPTSVRAHRTG
nr:transposase [Serinibacter salmoneus]